MKTTTWRLKRVRANLGYGRNERWDGMRLAIYNMLEGKPAEIIWPKTGKPEFVMPYGIPRLIATWWELPVSYDLPKPKFVVALEQYYDPPFCDTFGAGYGRRGADQHRVRAYVVGARKSAVLIVRTLTARDYHGAP